MHDGLLSATCWAKKYGTMVSWHDPWLRRVTSARCLWNACPLGRPRPAVGPRDGPMTSWLQPVGTWRTPHGSGDPHVGVSIGEAQNLGPSTRGLIATVAFFAVIVIIITVYTPLTDVYTPFVLVEPEAACLRLAPLAGQRVGEASNPGPPKGRRVMSAGPTPASASSASASSPAPPPACGVWQFLSQSRSADHLSVESPVGDSAIVEVPPPPVQKHIQALACQRRGVLRGLHGPPARAQVGLQVHLLPGHLVWGGLSEGRFFLPPVQPRMCHRRCCHPRQQRRPAAGAPPPPAILPPVQPEPALEVVPAHRVPSGARGFDELLADVASRPAPNTLEHIPGHHRLRCADLFRDFFSSHAAAEKTVAKGGAAAHGQALRASRLLWAAPTLLLHSCLAPREDVLAAPTMPALAKGIERANMVRHRLQLAEQGNWEKFMQEYLNDRDVADQLALSRARDAEHAAPLEGRGSARR